MLALSDLDIDLIRSEKKTLIRFSLLYLSLCLIILIFIGYIFYVFKKDLMLEKQRIKLQDYSSDFIYRLKDLHINFDKYKFYPRDERYRSAIYDSSKKKIFSTLKSENIKFNKVIYLTNNQVQYITQPESYYLGAKYIIIEITENKDWLDSLEKSLLFIYAVVFLFMLFIGYFLLNMVLKPMRESMYLLDRFIKDTTHELNTPVSTIVTNIEMIKSNDLDEKLKTKINRIDIGAKTISNIYEDLTYLTLNNKIISKNENINLSLLLEQRIDYFSTLANARKIDFILNLKDEVFIKIDKKKISKLIDNLLSNAIKYNKVKGVIKITLEDNFFIIEDSGKGMSEKQIDKLFIRYKRFDKSVGGFGIGLNIVSLIAKEYKLKIEYNSKIQKGTKVKVKWKE
ncbi:HAMP domain-containing sensor histidine kinase [Arcobacter sp. CECT 8985]|uniref:sensor histidine kinase n=1 Tax=Arcobacter sp. CECT 8985 TaxID=1935424 RepID=UPI00100A6F26|nr:HAMP domain-containing sensor histidine kinase [Arcobacter sp. CECT 8985]RXJ83880.1 two-component sensor histidine kinase [Arcobacter sp. CECT 8985]